MKRIVFFGLVFMLFSCSSDVSEIKSGGENTNFAARTAGNGFYFEDSIMVFQDKESLNRTIDMLNELDKDDEALNRFFEPFYEDGFHPLYLNCDEDNSRFRDVFESRKLARNIEIEKYSPNYYRANELYSDDDDLINDDIFASLLNDKREINVEGLLYRYTYSGLYRVDAKNRRELDNYIDNNNLAYTVPTIIPSAIGFQPVVNTTISIWTPSPVESVLPCSGDFGTQGELTNTLTEFGTSGLQTLMPCEPSNNNPQSSETSFQFRVASQMDFMENLEPCDQMNGFLNSLGGVFGQVRKCNDYFSDRRRTKTKYWKENYLIFNSIGVKVKHQKFKNVFFGAGWWYASKTNEVALSISQASFQFTMPIPNFPQSLETPKLVFFDGRIFNSNGQLISYLNNYTTPPGPQLPFSSEVVITEYISNNFGLELSHEDVREAFYSGVWQGAKALVQQYKQRDPKNVTYVLYTPTKIYVNYVDLERRKLDSKKIVNRLDYNWGAGIKFNVYFDGNGNYGTNLGDFASDPLGFISLPNLYDYDSVKMDFVGATRHNEIWKGSRIVYSD